MAQRGVVYRALLRHSLQDFIRNLKREFSKLLVAMQAYALICVGVRLIVTHTAGRSPRATVVHTQGGGTMRDNIVTVLGAASANALQPFTAQLLGTCTATGFVSSPAAGSGRSSGDRQYFYVNGRPVDLPRVAKTLNEVYRAFNSAQFPAAVLDFRLPTDAYDVNVTPDKRRVMLHAEDELLSALHDALTAAYDPSRRTLAVGNAAVPGSKSSMKSKRGSGLPRHANEADWISDSKDTDADEEEDEADEDSEPELSLGSDASGSHGEGERRASKRMRSGHAPMEAPAAAAAALSGDQLPEAKGRLESPPAPPSAAPAARHLPCTVAKQAKTAGRPTAEQMLMHRYVSEPAPISERFHDGESGAVIEDGALCAPVSAAATSGPAAETPVPIDVDAPEVGGMPAAQQGHYGSDAPLSAEQHRTSGETAVLLFDLASMRVSFRAFACVTSCTQLTPRGARLRQAKRAARLHHTDAAPGVRGQHSSFAAASLQAGAAERVGGADADLAATAELERCFKRDDFAALRVVGQFNLGFILATLGHDLFIIDQHASDEIYNFERLRRTTCLNKQPLISPQLLDLSPAEQQSVQQHADVFRANGFEFDELPALGELAPKLRLTAVPFSKNTTFGVADVQELLALLDGGAAATPTQPSAGMPFGSLDAGVVRPSRVRAMLAMRACRCSIMIGRALDTQQVRLPTLHGQ